MQWQRDVMDVAMEIDPATGRLFYRRVVLTCPRQMGKTSITLPIWFHRMWKWPGSRVAWTMQNGQAAAHKWQNEHVPIIQQSPLYGLVKPGAAGIRTQNGSQHVALSNGSMQTLLGSSKTAGHGDICDLGMIDEAMGQPDDRLEQALTPAMKTRHGKGMPGAQLWIISTAGPADGSEWFHAESDAGRAAVDAGECEAARLCYIEYSADEDADPGDPVTWWSCMPALGHTITEDTVAADYRQALLTPDGLAGFRRASLNQRTAHRANPPWPLDEWDGLAGPADRPAEGLVFAVDVSPDQVSAAVAVCWRRDDGVPHALVVEHRPGTGWLAARVAELRSEWGGVWVLDPRGASASQAAGWDGVLATPSDAKRGCAVLDAAVRSGQLGHYGQPELRAALAGAVKKPGEDGGWTWARRSTTVDISPLVAVTLAHGGLLGGVGEVVVGDALLSLW